MLLPKKKFVQKCKNVETDKFNEIPSYEEFKKKKGADKEKFLATIERVKNDKDAKIFFNVFDEDSIESSENCLGVGVSSEELVLSFAESR